MELLLKCDNVDINTGKHSEGKTPLYVACEQGHPSIVQVLLNHPEIDANKGMHTGIYTLAVHTGYTPLMVVAEHNNSEILGMLLEHTKIEINKEEVKGHTALTVASSIGNLGIMKELLKNNMTDINKGKITPLGYACLRRRHSHIDLDAVKFLLKNPQIDVNKGEEQGPLYIASNNEPETPQIVDLLLNFPTIHVNRKNGKAGETALYHAARKGRREAVKLLLNHPSIDANIGRTIDGSTPLFVAARWGESELVTIFLNSSKVDVNKERTKDGRTALFIASRFGHYSIVKMILNDSKSDVNKADTNSGMTPLQIAVVKARENDNRDDLSWEDVVKALLNHTDINVNKGDRLGRTPLYLMALQYAALKEIEDIAHKNNWVRIKNQNKMVTLLLNKTLIDVNKGTFNRTNALIVASEDGNLDVIKMLLAHVTIDVNYANFNGSTAFFYACFNAPEQKQKDVMELFLRCPKVNINAKDEEDRSIMDYAVEQGRSDIINAFKSRRNLLLKGHSCCSDQVNTGLQIATEAGNLKWVDTFLQCPQIDVNQGDKYGFTPLYLASRESNDSIQCNMSDPSYIMSYHTSYHYPCHLNIMEILLEQHYIEVNLEVNFKTALMIAAERGNEKALSLLLKHYQIDVNQQNAGDGKTALIFAAEQGHHGAVMLLLHNHQINPNVLDFYGESALRKASLRGYLSIVKLLLRCPKTDASHNVATQFVHSLNEQDEGTFVVHKEITEAILFHFVLLQIGTTCCHDVNENLLNSVKQGNHREVRGILQCPDSDINVRDSRGNTALYIASLLNHVGVIEVLLNNYKIDPNKGVILDGGTAFSIASEKSHFKIMGLLVTWDLVRDVETLVALGWCGDCWTNYFSNCKEPKQTIPTHIPTSEKPTGEH